MTDHSNTLAAAVPNVRALPLLRLYIALKLVILVVLALNTRFVMDEFWTISQPVWLFNGTFESIWPGKAVGYVLFYEIAHAIGWDATSILLVARLTTVGLVLGLVWIVYRLTRALGHDRVTALVALALLLSVSTFIERGFRLRSEPLAILLAAISLYVVVRGGLDETRSLLVAGLFSGLAFVTTQKSIYFNVALGAALVLDAWATRRLWLGVRRGTLLVSGWAVALAIYCIGFGGAEAFAVLRNLATGPMQLALEGGSYYEGLNQFIIQTFERNLLAWGLMLVGLALALRNLKEAGAKRVAVIFTICIVGFVFFHNQTWPYVFTMVLPFLAPWAAMALRQLSNQGRTGTVLVLAFAVGIAVTSLQRNLLYLAHDNAAQLAVIQDAEARLGPDDTYFDGIGMIPSRRMEPRVWLDAQRVRRTLDEGMEGDIPRALMGPDRPALIIESYRTNTLAEVLGPSLRRGYSRVTSHLLIRSEEGGAAHDPTREPLFTGIYSD